MKPLFFKFYARLNLFLGAFFAFATIDNLTKDKYPLSIKILYIIATITFLTNWNLIKNNWIKTLRKQLVKNKIKQYQKNKTSKFSQQSILIAVLLLNLCLSLYFSLAVLFTLTLAYSLFTKIFLIIATVTSFLTWIILLKQFVGISKDHSEIKEP